MSDTQDQPAPAFDPQPQPDTQPLPTDAPQPEVPAEPAEEKKPVTNETLHDRLVAFEEKVMLELRALHRRL